MPLVKERQATSSAPYFEPMGSWESSAAKPGTNSAKKRQAPRPEPSLSLMVRSGTRLSAHLVLPATTDRKLEMPLVKERQARSLAPHFEPMGSWGCLVAKLEKH
jgi:hypothetical protein